MAKKYVSSLLGIDDVITASGKNPKLQSFYLID